MVVEIIRHGETDLQAEHRYQGRLDVPLSEQGRRQLLRADESPETVIVTDLRRTRETAGILFPEAVQVICPGLREMDFGRFEGKNYLEMADDPDYRQWVDGGCLGTCPGGEARADFEDRVCTAFRTLIRQARQEGKKQLVIVAHGGTQMAVMSRLCTEKRDYYDWHLMSGQGFKVLAGNQEAERFLTLMSVTEHTDR